MRIFLYIITPLMLFSWWARADFAQGSNSALANLGFDNGGIILGFEFEHGYDRTYGIGAYFRMEQEEDGNEYIDADGLTTVGAFIRPHFNRQNWDFYVSPGFGFVSYDPAASGRDKESVLGPSLGIGLLYDFNARVAVGVEHFIISGWFGEDDYLGTLSEELTLKARFIF